jgi:hypothetical protein
MAARSEGLQNDLRQLRNRVVALSAQHHVGIPEIVSNHIVFTEQELNAGLLLAQEQELSRSGSSIRMVSPAVSRIRPMDQHVDDRSQRLRGRSTRTTGSGHSQEDEYADQFEDDLRRLSVSEDVQRDYTRVVHASAPPNEGVSKQEKSSWAPVEGRAFGVELETLLYKKSDEFLLDNSVKASRDVAPTLKARLGPGYDFRFFDYQSAKDDREYSAWKITTDLSIRSEDGRSIFGLEFVTPKMVGGAGLLQVEEVADELQRFGFATNNSTALHVHVSVEDLTNDQILRFCEYQTVFEHVIDKLMTVPRRGDYSRYCRSNLRSISMTRDLQAALSGFTKLNLSKSITPLIRYYCPRLSAVRNSHRNHKVNLLLLAKTKHKTPGRRIEFRQHQGSCDRQEIGAWVSLLLKWVSTAHKMPRPTESDGTLENFWKIIDDHQLRTYYTVKMQTLPNAVDFTYDSRELYAYNDNEIEPSDLDEEEITVKIPATGPPPAVSPATEARLAPPQSPQLTSPTNDSTPTALNEPTLVLMTKGAAGFPNHPVPPVRRDPSLSTSGRERQHTSMLDAASVAGDRSAFSSGCPVVPSAEGDDDREDSMMGTMVGILNMRSGRRETVHSFSLGNHMFTCALRLEAHYYGEGCVAYDEIAVTSPSIVVKQEADSKDPRNWFITAPTEPSRSGRRQTGVRWISPWLTEARGLETASEVVHHIQNACQIDEEQFFFVHIAVNHRSNSEIGLICASVVAFEHALCELMNLPSPQAPFSSLKERVAQIVALTSAASGEPFPQISHLMMMTLLGKPNSPFVPGTGAKIVHLRSLTNTVFKAPKRSLLFEIGSVSVEGLAQRAAFLAFFCAHCTKKMTPKILEELSNGSPQSVQSLVTMVDTLPSSLVRALSR